MSKSVKVSKLPICDICNTNYHLIETAQYDGKTIFGPWANMCEECFTKYGIGLGTGLGQMLILDNGGENNV